MCFYQITIFYLRPHFWTFLLPLLGSLGHCQPCLALPIHPKAHCTVSTAQDSVSFSPGSLATGSVTPQQGWPPAPHSSLLPDGRLQQAGSAHTPTSQPGSQHKGLGLFQCPTAALLLSWVLEQAQTTRLCPAAGHHGTVTAFPSYPRTANLTRYCNQPCTAKHRTPSGSLLFHLQSRVCRMYKPRFPVQSISHVLQLENQINAFKIHVLFGKCVSPATGPAAVCVEAGKQQLRIRSLAPCLCFCLQMVSLHCEEEGENNVPSRATVKRAHVLLLKDYSTIQKYIVRSKGRTVACISEAHLAMRTLQHE